MRLTSDQYAVQSCSGDGAKTFCEQLCQGLWVPAFAGTTKSYAARMVVMNRSSS
jgi:hypothetical protein